MAPRRNSLWLWLLRLAEDVRGRISELDGEAYDSGESSSGCGRDSEGTPTILH